MVDITIVPYCKDSGHKLAGGVCVYCNEPIGRIDKFINATNRLLLAVARGVISPAQYSKRKLELERFYGI